jgi:hypothetical protein
VQQNGERGRARTGGGCSRVMNQFIEQKQSRASKKKAALKDGVRSRL